MGLCVVLVGTGLKARQLFITLETFHSPLLKYGNIEHPPLLIMDKTLTSCVKTTAKLSLPLPLQHGKNFLCPSPFL